MQILGVVGLQLLRIALIAGAIVLAGDDEWRLRFAASVQESRTLRVVVEVVATVFMATTPVAWILVGGLAVLLTCVGGYRRSRRYGRAFRFFGRSGLRSRLRGNSSTALAAYGGAIVVVATATGWALVVGHSSEPQYVLVATFLAVHVIVGLTLAAHGPGSHVYRSTTALARRNVVRGSARDTAWVHLLTPIAVVILAWPGLAPPCGAV